MNLAFLKEYVNRWRHTRGYGVHSPLAYRIVKDCIRPDSKYGFYSDAYLDFEYHEKRKALRHARMAIRLINLLRPQCIWYPHGDKRLCNAIKMSFPSIPLATQKECPKNVDFIISSGSGELKSLWEKMEVSEECIMLVCRRIEEGELSEIEKAPTMILYGKNFTLMLRRIGMDIISYNI